MALTMVLFVGLLSMVQPAGAANVTSAPKDPPTQAPTAAKPTDAPTQAAKAIENKPATKAPSAETKPEDKPAKVTPPGDQPIKKLDAPDLSGNMTVCQCAGVEDAKHQGGSDCKSRNQHNGWAYCFVKAGACADARKFQSKLVAFKEGFDISYDACDCANKNKGCKCAGKTDAKGNGGGQCNTTAHPGTPPFCYVDKGSCCDGQPSAKLDKTLPDLEYSHDACACKTNWALCRCEKRFDDRGHGMCNSLLSETQGDTAKPFCYTRPGACCDGQPHVLHRKTARGFKEPIMYHVSWEACHGRLNKFARPHTRGPQNFSGKPIGTDSSSGAMVPIVICLFLAIFAGVGYWCYQYKKRTQAATGTPGAGVATPAGGGRPTVNLNRHRPPPNVYGPLTGKVRVAAPAKPLDGKVMWASSYNEESNTYVCKTHEAGPKGVQPHHINAEHLVAEVE